MKNSHFLLLLLTVVLVLTVPKCIEAANTPYNTFLSKGKISFRADHFNGTFIKAETGGYVLRVYSNVFDEGYRDEQTIYKMERVKDFITFTNDFQEYQLTFKKGTLITVKQIMQEIPQHGIQYMELEYDQLNNKEKAKENGTRERQI